MINSKSNIATVAALAILVGVVLGAAWWLAQDRASAQEILYSACEQTEAQQDFDFDGEIITATPTGATYKGSMSGNDFEITIILTDPDGILEVRGVDGVSYYREDGGGWKIDEVGTLALGYFRYMINSKAVPLGEDVLCPEGAVASVGFENVDGVATEHFTLTEHPSESVGPVGAVDDLTGDADENVLSRRYDYWVGPDGLLVKTKHVTTVKTGEYLDVTTTISGVGEPNVITAPAIP